MFTNNKNKFHDQSINIILLLTSLMLVSLNVHAFNNEVEDEYKSEHKSKFFTPKSLKGEYVLIGKGDSQFTGPETVTGVIKFDGENNFSGNLSSNTGAALGERVANGFSISGTYSIEKSGRGVVIVSETNESSIFVVTQADYKSGVKKASTISFVMDSLSASGNLISGFIKSRERKHDYKMESLNGDYGFINEGLGGLDNAISVGNVNFSAKTSIVGGDFTINVPVVPGQNERMLFDFFSAGPYTVNSDGTGTTFSETTGGSSRFIITKSESHKGRERATEIYFVPEFLDPVGNFSPAYMTRID